MGTNSNQKWRLLFRAEQIGIKLGRLGSYDILLPCRLDAIFLSWNTQPWKVALVSICFHRRPEADFDAECRDSRGRCNRCFRGLRPQRPLPSLDLPTITLICQGLFAKKPLILKYRCSFLTQCDWWLYKKGKQPAPIIFFLFSCTCYALKISPLKVNDNFFRAQMILWCWQWRVARFIWLNWQKMKMTTNTW